MKAILFTLLCMLTVVFLGACGAGIASIQPPVPNGNDDPTTIPVWLQMNSEAKPASNTDVHLFVSATPSMIGFVDFITDTVYTTITSRIINDLAQRGNIYIHRVDLDIPLQDMRMYSFSDFIIDFTNPSFYSYRNQGVLPGWYRFENYNNFTEALVVFEAGDDIDDGATFSRREERILQAASQGMPASVTALAISHFNPSALNVLITDFYDMRAGQRIFSELSNNFLAQGLAVGVLAVQSGFFGDLPDFRQPGEPITVNVRPSWEVARGNIDHVGLDLRPFYILLAGSYEDVYAIVSDFPRTLDRLYGAAYRNLIYEAVMYYSLFSDGYFCEDSLAIATYGNMVNNAFSYDYDAYILYVRNRRGQPNYMSVHLRYNQNMVLNPSVLNYQHFIINSVLTEINTQTNNSDFEYNHSLTDGNLLELGFDFTNLPEGTYMLETTIKIRPPDRNFNNLFRRPAYRNLSNWSKLISPGGLFEMVGRQLADARATRTYLISFPFNRTIGLEEFTESLENAALAGMTPQYLGTVRFVIKTQ